MQTALLYLLVTIQMIQMEMLKPLRLTGCGAFDSVYLWCFSGSINTRIFHIITVKLQVSLQGL